MGERDRFDEMAAAIVYSVNAPMGLHACARLGEAIAAAIRTAVAEEREAIALAGEAEADAHVRNARDGGRVYAEERQLALLAEWGCDLFQGFLGAGALDEAELSRLFEAGATGPRNAPEGLRSMAHA